MQFTVPYLQFCTFTFAHAFLGISCAKTVWPGAGWRAGASGGSYSWARTTVDQVVVGAEASYASTPRGVRLSGQAAELGSWQRAWKDGDQLRTLQSRKSQYCSQY